MWSGSRELRLARESVAPWRRSSAGWMPERTGRYTDGVGRRHPVTMRKASFITLSISRMCTLRHQTGAQYSAIEQTRDRAAVRNVLALAPQPVPASRLNSETRAHNFLRNASR